MSLHSPAVTATDTGLSAETAPAEGKVAVELHIPSPLITVISTQGASGTN